MIKTYQNDDSTPISLIKTVEDFFNALSPEWEPLLLSLRQTLIGETLEWLESCPEESSKVCLQEYFDLKADYQSLSEQVKLHRDTLTKLQASPPHLPPLTQELDDAFQVLIDQLDQGREHYLQLKAQLNWFNATLAWMDICSEETESNEPDNRLEFQQKQQELLQICEVLSDQLAFGDLMLAFYKYLTD